MFNHKCAHILLNGGKSGKGKMAGDEQWKEFERMTTNYYIYLHLKHSSCNAMSYVK